MLREACWLSVVAAVVLAGSERIARSQRGSEVEPEPAVITADELFADPEAMEEGINVRLDNAVIRAKSGILLRVAAGTHEIFVSPADPSSLEFLAVGARVDVQGTLRRSPSARQAQLVYAMGPVEARHLARSRFYVDAWVVSAVD